MNRHLVVAAIRLLCTLGSVFVVFMLFNSRWCRGEARVVAGVVSHIGVAGVGGVYGSRILVRPEHHAPFLASLTPSCASLGAVLAFTSVAVFMLHGPVSRRVLAVAVAASIVMACNLTRIGLSLVVGVHYGSHAMIVFHDWVGTVMGLFAVLGGFTFFVFTLLPSNKHLLEAARAR